MVRFWLMQPEPGGGTMIDAARGILTLAALYVIVCAFWPLRPFRSRRQVLTRGMPFVLIVLVFNAFTAPGSDQRLAEYRARQQQDQINKYGEWADEEIVSGLPASIGRAKEALTSYYRDRIYPTAECGAKLFSGRYLIRCYPTPENAQVPGGLMTVSRKDGGIVVTAVNGRAGGHLQAASSIRHPNGTYIAVGDPREQTVLDYALSIDISKALEEVE
jgi:hypothetical protein